MGNAVSDYLELSISVEVGEMEVRMHDCTKLMIRCFLDNVINGLGM